jgi:hypothetical protein
LGVDLEHLALSLQFAGQQVADAELLTDLAGCECQGFDSQRGMLRNDDEVAKPVRL